MMFNHSERGTGIQTYRAMLQRKYMTVELAMLEIDRILLARKAHGLDVLPPERVMAKEIHCSLMTLRRALERMEELGRIVRENGVKRICNTARNLPRSHTVVAVFIAAGTTSPDHPHYRQIAEQLEARFSGTAVHMKQLLLSGKDTPLSLKRKLEQATPYPGLPDVIIYANAPEHLRAPLLSLRGKSLLVGVNEEYIGMCDALVALNNFEAGRLAGQALWNAGAGNPVVIYDHRDILPFYHRRDGFLTFLAEVGLPIQHAALPLKSDGGPGNSGRLDELLNIICNRRHDGLFLFTDESSQRWRTALERKFRIPEEFKIITLAASGVSLDPEHPITAVSHGAPEIAQAIEDLIVARAQNRPFQKITLITPKILPGGTLQVASSSESRTM